MGFNSGFKELSSYAFFFLLCLQECLKRPLLGAMYQNVHSTSSNCSVCPVYQCTTMLTVRVVIALYVRCIKYNVRVQINLFS